LEADGRLIGSIQGYRDGLPDGVFGLGIELFDERDRCRGHGIAAVKEIVARLFDREGARRVEAGTADDNAAMRAVLERLGFVGGRPGRRLRDVRDDEGRLRGR